MELWLRSDTVGPKIQAVLISTIPGYVIKICVLEAGSIVLGKWLIPPPQNPQEPVGAIHIRVFILFNLPQAPQLTAFTQDSCGGGEPQISI